MPDYLYHVYQTRPAAIPEAGPGIPANVSREGEMERVLIAVLRAEDLKHCLKFPYVDSMSNIEILGEPGAPSICADCQLEIATRDEMCDECAYHYASLAPDQEVA